MQLKLALFSFLVSGVALAEPLPTTLRDGSNRFLSRSLGSACYTMESVVRGLPCNPAAIAKVHRTRFDTDLFLGTKEEYLKEAENLLNDASDSNAVAALFARRESIEAEVSVEASLLSSKWGVAIEPYRLVAVSQLENSSLPMVDLVIAEEQSVKGQLASYVQDNFYAGLQARYTHVRFIGQYFSLSDAFAGDNEDLFKSQTQEIIYLEPGFLYAWEETPWQPQISAVLAHWGWSEKKTDPYTIQPTGLLGASIKPVLPLGLLEVGAQFQINVQTQNLQDCFRFATAYHLGILQAVLSLSESDRSAGFLVTYKNLTSGLSYWDEKDSRGVFIQMGVTL